MICVFEIDFFSILSMKNVICSISMDMKICMQFVVLLMHKRSNFRSLASIGICMVYNWNSMKLCSFLIPFHAKFVYLHYCYYHQFSWGGYCMSAVHTNKMNVCLCVFGIRTQGNHFNATKITFFFDCSRKKEENWKESHTKYNKFEQYCCTIVSLNFDTHKKNWKNCNRTAIAQQQQQKYHQNNTIT